MQVSKTLFCKSTAMLPQKHSRFLSTAFSRAAYKKLATRCAILTQQQKILFLFPQFSRFVFAPNAGDWDII